MKKETKDLFEYLKAAVRVATKDINSGLEHFQTSEEKIIEQVEKLEKKLLQVEKYSKMGGFILDRNENVCKHGDKVKWSFGDTETVGTLEFDTMQNRFFIVSLESEICICCDPEKLNIELIEQTEKIDI